MHTIAEASPGRALFVVGFAALVLVTAGVLPAQDDLLVLLSETGDEREGLPVLELHSGDEQTAAALGSGLPGTLLRVYRWTQFYLQREEGIPAEPAWVLLSERQGGFAGTGFYLGREDKTRSGYVDLYRGWPTTGRFGAMDQLFPHELAHVLRLQLAGPMDDGNANQVHALGVRTDRIMAFNEGFAEHFQVLAIDHPEADPATRALAGDSERFLAVARRLDAYRGELTARWAPVPRMRMGFLAWFSNDEDVLRYDAVKANAFARQAPLPARLLEGGDPYRAYLLDNILPGRPRDPPKPLPRMIATEGVISAFFHRWATDPEIRESYRDEAFYALFGATRDEVGPLANVYLKLFHVFYVHKPQDVLDVIAGYGRTFPDEVRRVEALAAEVFLGQPIAAVPEIWLANPDFFTGTTVFDQYRGLPRMHTFELNGASVVDLVGVPGVDAATARKILDAAPLESVRDLRRLPGVGAELVTRFESMAGEMDRLRAEAEEQSVEDVISISTILRPFAWRAVGALAVSGVLGALLYGAVRSGGATGSSPPRWWRTALNGLAAAVVGLSAGWALTAWGALLAVAGLFGIPAGAWCLWRTRRPRLAVRVLLAWLLASLPAAVAVAPLF